MRIALTITELDPGGAETCIVHLAKFLKAAGHCVQVYSLGPAPSRTKLIEQLDQAGIGWKCGGGSNWFSTFSVVRWLRHELQQFKPDVVQSMLFHANLITSFSLPQGDVKFFGGARVRQPQRVRHWLQRWSTSRMEKLICVSESVAHCCREQERIAADKIVVIPNGVDISHLEQLTKQPGESKLSLPENAPVLLFVGRLDPQKQIDKLISESNSFLEQLPNHHLIVIGDGPLREKILELRALSSNPDRIHILGWLANPYPWMDRCEMLLLPTAYEGMPNVLIEAMGLAKPVVTFEVDGCLELFGPEQTCLPQVVPPNNFSIFVRSLILLAKDPKLRNQYSTINRTRIEQSFQLDAQLSKYVDLYESAFAKGK